MASQGYNSWKRQVLLWITGRLQHVLASLVDPRLMIALCPGEASSVVASYKDRQTSFGTISGTFVCMLVPHDSIRDETDVIGTIPGV